MLNQEKKTITMNDLNSNNRTMYIDLVSDFNKKYGAFPNWEHKELSIKDIHEMTGCLKRTFYVMDFFDQQDWLLCFRADIIEHLLQKHPQKFINHDKECARNIICNFRFNVAYKPLKLEYLNELEFNRKAWHDEIHVFSKDIAYDTFFGLYNKCDSLNIIDFVELKLKHYLTKI